jgi:hypothetical protein
MKKDILRIRTKSQKKSKFSYTPVIAKRKKDYGDFCPICGDGVLELRVMFRKTLSRLKPLIHSRRYPKW